MTGRELLADLAACGVLVSAKEGKLSYRAPPGLLTDAMKAKLSHYRDEILAALGVPIPKAEAPTSQVIDIRIPDGRVFTVEIESLLCPGCKKPLDEKARCWKCDYRICTGCGKASGSAFIELCTACGLKEE